MLISVTHYNAVYAKKAGAGTKGLFMLLLSVFVCVFQFLSEVGFSNVRAEDRTEQFIQAIKAELQRAEEMKEEFIQVNSHSCLCNVCITFTTTYLHAVGGNIFPFSLPFYLNHICRH